jgi:lia operon protein LiaG
MPYCRKCGAELTVDANFCAKCGTAVAKGESMPVTQHQTFKVTGNPKLVIVNRAPGKVDVKTTEESEVTVDLDLKEPDDLEYGISQEANTVTVRCRALVHPFRWPRYFVSGGPRADVVVSIPKEADLDLETTLDQVAVTGIKGSMKIETSVARVTLENLEGTIDVTGKTGSIDLRNVNGTVSVDSTTGPVTLENVNGTVSVRNTTGPIRFVGSLSNGENWFKTSTGPIDLALTGKSDLAVEAYSRLGRVTCIPELTDARFERGQYVGRIGAGTGKLIAETKTGSITIRQ